MDTPLAESVAAERRGVRARPELALLKRHWRWATLLLVALVPRLYLLHRFDIELSNDGFDAVTTLGLFQVGGPAAIPRDLIDRFILHPLYMFLLYGLRLVTPASFDLYLAARFLSTVIACVAILVFFEFVRRSFDEPAAWVAALLLAFAPSFLWESVAILSSTLFLALYLGVLLALAHSRYRAAAFLALLASLTRYEGVVLMALTFIALSFHTWRARKFTAETWLTCIGLALAVPLAIIAAGGLTTGNPLEFLGAQSMASIWLRFLAPGDWAKHATFFITRYRDLFPEPVVWLGLAGAVLAVFALLRARASQPAEKSDRIGPTALLLITSALYLVFFETLVWFNYTTLEVRFLMYPGLPLLVFAGVALAAAREWLARFRPAQLAVDAVAAVVVLALVIASYQQGLAGMQFIYNMHASQREVADELALILPPHQRTNTMIYGGISGALDLFARQHGLQLAFTDFRYAPDDRPEQFLVDRQIRFIIYPAGNAFASAKYPYLAHFETQTHAGVTFQALTQFATSTDNQLYSLWSVSW